LPVTGHTQVISVEKPDGEKYFTVSVSENETAKNYQSKQVIVTSGSQNEKKFLRLQEIFLLIFCNCIQLNTGMLHYKIFALPSCLQ